MSNYNATFFTGCGCAENVLILMCDFSATRIGLLDGPASGLLGGWLKHYIQCFCVDGRCVGYCDGGGGRPIGSAQVV